MIRSCKSSALVLRAITCVASTTVALVVSSTLNAGVALADGPNTVPPGYTAQAFNAAQGPLLTLKMAAGAAYSRWKTGIGSWGDFVAAETAFDNSAGLPAKDDSLLTSGGSKA